MELEGKEMGKAEGNSMWKDSYQTDVSKLCKWAMFLSYFLRNILGWFVSLTKNTETHIIYSDIAFWLAIRFSCLNSMHEKTSTLNQQAHLLLVLHDEEKIS